MKRYTFYCMAITTIFFVAGCIENNPKEDIATITSGPFLKSNPTDFCIHLCEQKLNEMTNLTNGPCLSDEVSYSDWVCDVAHNPRQAIDDLPENQCSTYTEGLAHHFVEVDENCEFIRAV